MRCRCIDLGSIPSFDVFMVLKKIEDLEKIFSSDNNIFDFYIPDYNNFEVFDYFLKIKYSIIDYMVDPYLFRKKYFESGHKYVLNFPVLKMKRLKDLNRIVNKTTNYIFVYNFKGTGITTNSLFFENIRNFLKLNKPDVKKYELVLGIRILYEGRFLYENILKAYKSYDKTYKIKFSFKKELLNIDNDSTLELLILIFYKYLQISKNNKVSEIMVQKYLLLIATILK